MRLPVPVFAALAASASPLAMAAASAAEVKAPSVVEAVTVYPRGALVTRTATLKVPAGEGVIRLPGLSAGLVVDSLTVQAQSTAKLRIGSVDVRHVDPTVDDEPEQTPLQKELRKLQDERAVLDDVITAANAEIRFLEGLTGGGPVPLGAGQPAARPTIGELKDVMALVGTGTREARERIRKAEWKQRDLDEAIARLQRKIDQAPQPTDMAVEAAVAYQADTEGETKVTVVYRVEQASWAPIYEARLSTGSAEKKPEVDLTTRARVRQSTGEDWSNVALTLSTARPQRGTQAPDLPSLIVRYAPPPRPAGMSAPDLAMRQRTAPAAAPEMMMAAPPAAGAAPKEMIVADEDAAAVETSGIDAVFKVPGKVTVEATDGDRLVKLAEAKLPAELTLKTAPRLDPAAYLVAGIKNDGQAAWLPGQVTLHRDGVFIGQTRLAPTAPGEERKLGFGPDDRVKVTRTALTKVEGTTGFIGTSKTEDHAYRIAVKNLTDRPIALLVEERLPVSEGDDIKVEPIRDMPAPTAKDPDGRRGVVQFSLAVEPGKERDMKIGWRVSWPSDKPVFWSDPGR